MKRRVVLVACSDARTQDDREEIEELKLLLNGYGLVVEESRYLYDSDARGREKAKELSDYFGDSEIAAIFDVSGGNVANELLPYLDYTVIEKSSAVFFGYSDLTTIINGIYTRTGKSSVLYQVRHLVGNEVRQREFEELLGCIEELRNRSGNGLETISETSSMLTKPDYYYIQGDGLKGTVVGGNLRCFLKLAGTGYMPDVKDKILLMEALGGDIYSIRSMMSQLQQLGVFGKVKGILVGTFTAIMKQGEYDRMIGILLTYIPDDIPVVVTKDIGHGYDAKGIWIGEEIML